MVFEAWETVGFLAQSCITLFKSACRLIFCSWWFLGYNDIGDFMSLWMSRGENERSF